MTKTFQTPGDNSLYESSSADAIMEYMTLLEDTESPREYLIWSLIAAAGGLVGRNAKFESGLITVRPNLFVILVGPAGVKKSTSIGFLNRLLEGTSVNFGPTDTGGQRHGLMSALASHHRAQSMKPLLTGLPVTSALLNPRNPADMLIMAPEMGRLFGQSNLEMANFFVDLYDGAAIDYQTKAGETRLRQPLVTLLGGTTPSSFASILPDNAATHGIISRMIFVYADQIHKLVPLPPEPTEEWYDAEDRLKRRLRWIDENRYDFSLDEKAKEVYTVLYPYRAQLDDPRLESYQARRRDHLLKVSICLAALRNSVRVNESDMRLAHELLQMIEPKMRRALEFFGKNKVYVGRMLILNYLRSSPTKAATDQELIAVATSELNPREAEEAIQALLKQGDIIRYGTSGQYVLNDRENRQIETKLK